MNIFNTHYVPLVKLHMVKERFLPYGSEKLYSPQSVASMISRIVEGADREYMLVVSLDGAKQPVGIEIIAIGSLNRAFVEAREIFKHAILTGAAGLILVHNHPSGDLEPGESDWNMTKRLRQAGSLLGIEVLDHIIIGGEEGSYTSLQELGRWDEYTAA